MPLIMRYCAKLKLQVNHFVNISMAVRNYHTGIVMERNPVSHWKHDPTNQLNMVSASLYHWANMEIARMCQLQLYVYKCIICQVQHF